MPLHPFFTERLPLLEGISGYADVLADPEKAARAARFDAADPAYVAPDVLVEDAQAPGRHGPVPVRTYAPRDAAPGVGLVWMHGGGFQAGDLDMREADFVARELCLRTAALVVSVDYRLCTGGVHYPVPHDDVVDAWRWATGELAGERRWALGGASAGGTLATGAALRIRDDRDAVQPAGLLLAYPVLHAVLPPPSEELTAKVDQLPPLLRFPPQMCTAINEGYVGGPAAEAPPYAFPASGDLRGLPPTWMLTSEYDDLRASADAFTAQLLAAGVQVEQRRELGVPHGHLNREPTLEPVDRSLEFFAAALQRVARPTTGP